MSDSKKKVPKRRFEEFSNANDWEQRKLGEVVDFLNGKAYKQQELLEFGKFRVLRVGNFNTNDRWYYSDLELDENKYANKGDLLYLWATNFGPEIWNEERVIYHYHIWKLQFLSNELDKQYLYTWLLTDKEKIKQTTNGTTMVHVTKGSIEQREFQYPTNKKEQQKIGTFFKQLDNTIALHQRKLEKIKALKTAYLSEMFPAEGESKPKRRFAGFTDDWDQRKLGEELNLLKDGTHGTHKDVKDGFYLLSAKNIKNGQIIIDELIDRKISEEEYNTIHKNFSLKKGDVLLTIVGSIGETSIIKSPTGITFQRSVAYLRPDKNLESQFLFTLINSNQFQDELKKRQVISAQPGIYLGDLSVIPIKVPNIEEQQKIGLFFKKLDNTIALHQRKLQKLQNIKKAYLNEMFI
ncbi:restriction endonuclease subunit S [Listeria seeligeri]|uniref:restriction endonuclease subunit S n=1 Tax=Listeria seeligeri TaxID=1640 RepID=UPI0018898064|nr:restriction endonuclease subunit S [Listeria seeligeri]MBF2510672.1 restriction endonuclease subunit S [Listeria seeligeri]MBF2526686.1 restriction endonuclease subunit S [Listeria seeligeri]